jgi:hypothetical protein
MADQNFKVWCLLIDRDYKASFGEPFPVSDIRPDDTIYDLKNKIKSGLEYDELSGISPNKMEIWKCYGGSAKKLCAYDSFGETKKALDSLKFSDERYSNGRIRTASQVQHLGVAQSVAQLPLEPDELLFVRIA